MSVIRGFALIPVAAAAILAAGPFVAGQAPADDPATHLQLATQLYESAQYRDAFDAYDQAMRADDAALVTRARKGKVRAAIRVAEFDTAWREAEILNSSAVPDGEAQTLLGDALWGMGRFDEADAAYRQALVDAPGITRARFGLARSLETLSRLDEALTEARIVAQESPEDGEVYALIGFIHERLNQFEEAAEAYERYVDMLPTQDVDLMRAVFRSKVRLLRSFKGRPPLQMDAEDAEAIHRVPFRLTNKKIVVRGRVNGMGVEFVLDTGSEYTALADTSARRAGIRVVTTTVTAGVGVPSVRRLDMGRADDIEIGTLKIRNVPVAIRRVARNSWLPRWQNESLSPLGLGLSVVVDYQRKEVTFARKLPDSEADFILPMRMHRLPMVKGVLNSTHPAYFVVDTGGELISISGETATALSMKPPRRIPLRVYGMSGLDADAYLLTGVNVDFEEIAYRNVGLAVLNLRAPSVLLGFQVGGIVGHWFLSDYRVSLDMDRSEVRLEKSERGRAPVSSH